MKNVFIFTIIALMAISSGLYAQEKEVVQEEPLPVQQQTGEIRLELVWEKEFEEGIVDVAFDKEMLLPKIIITGKSLTAVNSVYFFDSNGAIISKEKLNQYDGHAEAIFSENREFVATFEPDGIEYGLEAHKGNVRIFDSNGKLLKNFYVIGGVDWLSKDGDVVIGTYLGGEVTLSITSSSKSYKFSEIKDATWLNIPSEFYKAWGDFVIIGATKTSNGYVGFRKKQKNLRYGNFLGLGDYLYWIDKNILYVVNEFGDIVHEYILNTSGSYSLTISQNSRYLLVLQRKYRDVYLINLLSQQIEWKLDEEYVKWRPWIRSDVSNNAQFVIGEEKRNFYFFDTIRQITIKNELPDDATIISALTNSTGNKIAIVTASGEIKCYSVLPTSGGEK